MERTPHALHVFFDQVTREIGSEYLRIRSRTVEDPGTAGDEGEENWKELLAQWIPDQYHIATKGRLIFADGQTSGQLDIVVLKPGYPKKMLNKKLYLADGVMAVFECKNTLKKQHISNAVQACSKLKRMFEKRQGTPRAELLSPIIFGVLAHSSVWKLAGSDGSKKIAASFEAAETEIEHPRFLVDLICIADMETWTRHLNALLQSVDSIISGLKRSDLTSVDWRAASALMFSSEEWPKNPFVRPIGVLVQNLIRRFAMSDEALRAFDSYYRRTGLTNTSSGNLREWPLSIYSDQVKSALLASATVRDDWSEWRHSFP